MSENVSDNTTGEAEFNIQRIHEGLDYARNQLKEKFLNIKMFPNGPVGFYMTEAT